MERTLLMRPHPRHLSNTLTGTTTEQEVEEGRERERERRGGLGGEDIVRDEEEMGV